MRKRLTYVSAVLVVAAVVAVAVVLAVAGTGASGTAEAARADLGPRAILEKAFAADRDVTSARADFTTTIVATLDPAAEAPAQAEMILGKPIEVSGTVAVDSDPFMGSMTVEVTLGGGGYSTQAAVRWIGDDAWIKVMGAWYEAPPEAEEELAEARQKMAAGRPETCPLEGTGLDPWAWVTDLTVDGSEPVGGVDAYRVSAGLDVRALIDDVVTFVATPQFEELLEEHAPPEAVEELRGADKAEIEEAAGIAADVVRDVSGEVWVETESFRVLKAAGSATIVAPAQAEVDWLQKVEISGTITYGGLDEPVQVEPPADPLPWQSLQGLGGTCGAPMLVD